MGKQRRNWLALAIVGALTGMSLHGSVHAAEADGEETAHELSETVVEAGRAKLAGGLVERRENIGLLGSKDVMETPFQAMTFGKKALEQFSVPDRTILDTLSLSPAVRVGQGATDSNVTIRGLSSNGNKWYINGVPGMAHQKDMTANFIDSVTVIAGPALGVRGTTAGWQENAGGVVDMISKKASAEGDREAKLSFHGKSYVSQSVDLGERFGENKEWGVRFNVLQGQGTLSVDHARMWKWGVYLNLDHKTANSTTNLLMGYDYTRQRGDGNSLSVAKTLKSLPKAPSGSVNFSPDWAEDTYNDWTFILNHEQKLSEHAKAFLNAGYHKENYTSWIQGYGRTLLNMDGDYASRAPSGWGSGYSQWPVAHETKYIGIGVKGDFKLGEWKSDYVLSLDKMWFRREVIGNYGSDPSDVYIPAPGNIYRSNSTPLNARFPKHTLKTQYNLQMLGWHIVDTFTAPGDKLGVTLGLHGHRGIRARNYAGSSASEIDASATCPTFAVTYQFTPQFMMYANHSESFDEGTVVGSSYANRGETIPPAKTKQNEVGVKYQSKGLLQTLSYYNMRKQGTNDVLRGGLKYLEIDKEQKYSGVEYSAVGKVSPQLDMILALNWLQAEQTDGNSVLGLPKWAGTAALVYKPTEDLSVIGRLNYSAKARIRHSDPLDVPAYTTFDLGLNYKTKISSKDVTFSLMCSNLFDKRYWYASGSSIALGMPRTVSLSASCDF